MSAAPTHQARAGEPRQLLQRAAHAYYVLDGIRAMILQITLQTLKKILKLEIVPLEKLTP